jgi:hypothetical protein
MIMAAAHTAVANETVVDFLGIAAPQETHEDRCNWHAGAKKSGNSGFY